MDFEDHRQAVQDHLADVGEPAANVRDISEGCYAVSELGIADGMKITPELAITCWKLVEACEKGFPEDLRM